MPSSRALSVVALAALAVLGCGSSQGAAGTTASSSSGPGGASGATTSASTGQGGLATSSSASSAAGGKGGQGGQGGGGGAHGCKALFCDDFEAGLDPTKWTVEVGYDQAIAFSVQAGQVAHGTKAGQAHLVDNTGGFALARETSTFPALADELWGRASFFTAVADGAGHTGFVSAYVADQRVLEIGVSNGTWQLTYYEPGKEFPVGYPAKVPQNKWSCLEWHFHRSGPALIEVYVDGAVAATYDASGHQPAQLTSLTIGMDDHSANPPGNDAYWDDVAIDANRIGCSL